jgi:hypothetical protein
MRWQQQPSSSGWDTDDELVDASLERFHCELKQQPAVGAQAYHAQNGHPGATAAPPSKRARGDSVTARTSLQPRDGGAPGLQDRSCGEMAVESTPPTPLSAGRLQQLRDCVVQGARQAEIGGPGGVASRREWCGATVLALVLGVEQSRSVETRNGSVDIASVQVADDSYPLLQVTLWREKAAWVDGAAPAISAGDLVQLTAVTFNSYRGAPSLHLNVTASADLQCYVVVGLTAVIRMPGTLSGNTARHSKLLRAWPAGAATPDAAGAARSGRQYKLARLLTLRAWAATHHAHLLLAVPRRGKSRVAANELVRHNRIRRAQTAVDEARVWTVGDGGAGGALRPRGAARERGWSVVGRFVPTLRRRRQARGSAGAGGTRWLYGYF